MSKEYNIWRGCALKAASSAINKECLSLLRDKQVGAEEKLLALRAMLNEQGRIELEYLKAMEGV